jgi:EAL domain-containing protein (putative c-di-GMP-specific phosphodiesterase class I)
MGVGYSGLRQITTVHPTYLKLDRSLIKDIDLDPDRGALVSALIGYATRTGGYLIAEGVETVAELETLQQLGVTLVQGFLLARPGPPWPAVAPARRLESEPAAERRGAGSAPTPALAQIAARVPE